MLNKRLLIGLLVVGMGFMFAGCSAGSETANPMSAQVPIMAPTSYVMDTSKVLSESAKNGIEQKLTAEAAHAQISVVTLPTTGSQDIDQYANAVFNKWGIGEKGKDNGILLIVATSDRKIRIEVGRGFEGQLTDSEAGRIIDTQIVPSLKANDWDTGITKGVDAIIQEVK